MSWLGLKKVKSVNIESTTNQDSQSSINNQSTGPINEQSTVLQLGKDVSDIKNGIVNIQKALKFLAENSVSRDWFKTEFIDSTPEFNNKLNDILTKVSQQPINIKSTSPSKDDIVKMLKDNELLIYKQVQATRIIGLSALVKSSQLDKGYTVRILDSLIRKGLIHKISRGIYQLS